MKITEGGITRPKGILASSVWCGIKKKKKDLCLIYSEAPASAAGVFTSNKVKAAPLILSKSHLRKGTARAILANSGNANCLTGSEGLKDAREIAQAVARELSIGQEDILIASTGVIGRRLPVEKVIFAVGALASALGSSSSTDIAKTLMTTDTVPKEIAVSIKIGSKAVNIGGVAKGAGMINPNMATMLAFMTSDALITPGALKKALKESVDASFNRITVDGDMSTNDCVFILANGLAGNEAIGHTGKNYGIFRDALTYVSFELAKKIVQDAEGATKFIKVTVSGAKSIVDAKKAAYAIATSPLVKTAFYGEDPNWGRIAAAAGRSGADLDAGRLDIYLGNEKVLGHGTPTGVDKGTLRKLFKKKEIEVSVNLNMGKKSAGLYTSDLSKKYIEINAHYTT